MNESSNAANRIKAIILYKDPNVSLSSKDYSYNLYNNLLRRVW